MILSTIRVVLILFLLSWEVVNFAFPQTLKRLEPIQHRERSSASGKDSISKSLAAAKDASSILPSQPCGSQLLTITKGKDETETYLLGRPNDVRIIVQFRSLPLSRVSPMGKGLSVPKVQYALITLRNEHAQFKSDLAMIEGSSSALQSSVTKSRIFAEYQTAFNGVAMTTTRKVARFIQDLPYVVKVWEDQTVKAFDDTSNAVIGAPAFWDSTGLHGEGIDISIIDTGIDYLHEALGGAAFPNSKVVGGYDFANDDSDPMDDYGHGTHVAGIAAGDGPPPTNLKGVAYKAHLWAYKVLNNAGTGYWSWIISGIERTLDPDQNPSTPTPISVINFSLGGPGEPDDPICQAIDNATASGIVCAVAVGNSGSAYGSINSPACARSAFAIGASNDNDKIADFSSRGPTYTDWYIKPDIVAPGVSILSAQQGGGYVVHDGTSMATPHVAGAAALLRQLHPDWTPNEIKAVFVQTAKNITGEDVFTQGGGRLSLTNALARNITITPTNLYFGIDDSPSSSWTSTRTLVLHNHEVSDVTITLSTKTNAVGGSSLTFNPSSITVPANGAASVEVTLNCNRVRVKEFNDWATEYPNYTGKILASVMSPSLSIQIPYTFIKSRILRFVMDESPWWFGITQRGSNLSASFDAWDSYIPQLNDTLNILWNAGMFEIYGSYDDVRTKIVKENIEVRDGLTAVHFQKSDAKNRIILHRLDQFGQPVPFNGAAGWGWAQKLIDPQGLGWTTSCGFWACPDGSTLDTLDFPDVSTFWRFSMQFATIQNGNYYAFAYSMPPGITSSVTLQNDPTAFREIDFKYIPKAGDSIVYVAPQMSLWYGNFQRISDLPPTPIRAPYELKAYLAPPLPPDTSIIYTQWVSEGPLEPLWYWHIRYYLLPMKISSSPDGVTILDNTYRQTPLFSTGTFPAKIKIGYSAPCWVGETNNIPSAIRIITGPNSSPSYGLFRGPLWDVPLKEGMPYKLFHLDTLISSGVYPGWPTSIQYTNVTPSEYVLELPSTQYMISDSLGTATARLEFDLSRPDPNPPTLQSLWVLSNGIPSDEFYPSDTGGIQFKCADDNSGVDSVKAFFRPFGGEESWSSVQVAQQGDRYIVYNLPGMPGGYTSMRLRVTDHSGNALDYRVEPAFVYHSLIVSTPICIFPAKGDTDLPAFLTLKWNPPVNAIHAMNTYHLQLASDSMFAHCLVDDSLLTKLSLRIGGLEKGTRYYWHISVKNVLGESPYSATWSFTTTKESTSVLFIRQGWNLISVPLQVKNIIKGNVFPTAISNAFSYTDQYYQMEDSLRKGYGYWLKFDKNDTMEIIGAPFDSDTINVGQGWNMVGSISSPIYVNGIVSEPSGMVASSFFGYTTSYNTTDSLKPGCGYWVKVEQTGKLILSRSASSLKSNRIRIVTTGEIPPPPPGEQPKAGKEIPREYSLEKNYPNPFNPSTIIYYQLPVESKVSMKIFNVLGQEIRTLVNDIQDAGFKSVEWNSINNYGNAIASGIYFYRLDAMSLADPNKSFSKVMKLLLVR